MASAVKVGEIYRILFVFLRRHVPSCRLCVRRADDLVKALNANEKNYEENKLNVVD